jgi:hypothetical protein
LRVEAACRARETEKYKALHWHAQHYTAQRGEELGVEAACAAQSVEGPPIHQLYQFAKVGPLAYPSYSCLLQLASSNTQKAFQTFNP